MVLVRIKPTQAFVQGALVLQDVFEGAADVAVGEHACVGYIIAFGAVRCPNHAPSNQQRIRKALTDVYAPYRDTGFNQRRAEMRHHLNWIARAATFSHHPMIEFGNRIHPIRLTTTAVGAKTQTDGAKSCWVWEDKVSRGLEAAFRCESLLRRPLARFGSSPGGS